MSWRVNNSETTLGESCVDPASINGGEVTFDTTDENAVAQYTCTTGSSAANPGCHTTYTSTCVKSPSIGGRLFWDSWPGHCDLPDNCPKPMEDFCYYGSVSSVDPYQQARDNCSTHNAFVLTLRNSEQVEYMQTNHEAILLVFIQQ